MPDCRPYAIENYIIKHYEGLIMSNANVELDAGHQGLSTKAKVNSAVALFNVGASLGLGIGYDMVFDGDKGEPRRDGDTAVIVFLMTLILFSLQIGINVLASKKCRDLVSECFRRLLCRSDESTDEENQGLIMQV